MRSLLRRLSLDGLTPEEAARAVAHRPCERLYFFDDQGRQVARFDGGESWVFYRLSETDRQRVRDGRIVHNHPPRLDVPPDDPRRDAESFSLFDWETGIRLDVRTMIAVSPAWRHELIRPAGGWLAVYRDEDQTLDMLRTLYEYVKADQLARIDRGVLSPERAEADRMHEVTDAFAHEIEAIYRRERP